MQQHERHDQRGLLPFGSVSKVCPCPVCGLGYGPEVHGQYGHADGDEAPAVGEEDGPLGGLGREDALEVALPGDPAQKEEESVVEPETGLMGFDLALPRGHVKVQVGHAIVVYSEGKSQALRGRKPIELEAF